jgi:hypothetical protein
MPDPYDPSLIDVLSGGSQDDARALASAMASQLRRKQLLAEMGATVPALAGTAKLQAQDVGEQQKLLGQAGMARLHYGAEQQALKQSLEQARNQTALQREMLRGQNALEVQRLRNMLKEAAGGAKQVVVGPDGNFVLVDKKTGTSVPVTSPGGESPLPQGKPLEPDVQKMAADAQFLSQMPADLQLLKTYVGTDRPGGGPLAGRMPDWATTEEGNAQRQAAQRIMNSIIYMTTGKQINEQEAKRLLLARGIGPTSSQAAFNVGVPKLEAELKRALSVYKAKYRPEVVNRFKERGGLDWAAPLEGADVPSPASDLRKKYGLE